jgi:hypothetical protein
MVMLLRVAMRAELSHVGDEKVDGADWYRGPTMVV